MDSSRHTSSGGSSSSASIKLYNSSGGHTSGGHGRSAITDGSPAVGTDSALQIQPFFKKYAWAAAAGLFIAVSGSLMLLTCSTSSKYTKRAIPSTTRGGVTGAALTYSGASTSQIRNGRRSKTGNIRSSFSQGTNTDNENAAGYVCARQDIKAQTAKGEFSPASITDADLCNPVPELINEGSSSTEGSSAALNPLVDVETLDRSAPITIYSSLPCPVQGTDKGRPSPWSEPCTVREDSDSSASQDCHTLQEPLNCRRELQISSPTFKRRKNVPCIGPASRNADSHFDVSDTDTDLRPSGRRFDLLTLSWRRRRICGFLKMFVLISTLICILSSSSYYYYLKMHPADRPFSAQQFKPLPVFRMFP
ncbi:hypothetical protein KP509_14G066700 [Ceratopteris richardii]|uniref:Uncharacterized protein n=1 Tax=Ceratopteris richardii TaxID=49495 RepID=A0A8T2TAR3_CERRI|nr:hypothetical protein KP509_14G066700 [Ceratopteris richardii]